MAVLAGYKIDTKASLKALSTADLITGYARLVLSEGTWFWYKADATDTADDTTILLPTSGAGRWFKLANNVNASDITNLNEFIEDRLGNNTFADTSTIDFTYDDSYNRITFSISNGSIVDAHISSTAAIAQSKIDGLTSALAGKANTSHTHTVSDITNFSESVDDRVATLLTPGTGITLTYNDSANSLIIASDGGGGSGGSGGSLGVEALTTSSFTFNAEAGKYYIVDVGSSNTLSINFPSSPTVGDTFYLRPYTGGIHLLLTVGMVYNKNVISVTNTYLNLTSGIYEYQFIYVNSTLGWLPANAVNMTLIAPDPSTVSDLLVWFKTGVGNITLNGSGNITNWSDLSGNARHGTFGTPLTYVSNAINGRDAVAFNGTSTSFLSFAQINFKTIFFVVKNTSTLDDRGNQPYNSRIISDSTYYYQGIYGDAGRIDSSLNFNPPNAGGYYCSWRNGWNDTSYIATNYSTLSEMYTDNKSVIYPSWKFYRLENNTAHHIDTLGVVNTNPYGITNSYLQIAEVFAYSRILTTTEVGILSDYCSALYGLT